MCIMVGRWECVNGNVGMLEAIDAKGTLQHGMEWGSGNSVEVEEKGKRVSVLIQTKGEEYIIVWASTDRTDGQTD